MHTKQINTLCGQNVGFVAAKPGGTYSNYWSPKTVHILVTVAELLAICIYIKCRMRVNFAMISAIVACSSLVRRDSNKVI